MVDYYGPLVHTAGADTSTVVDPRFGTAAIPTQPVGWGGGGGEGGGAAEGVLLTGPHADWGAAVNSALAANGTVRVASGLGDIPLRTEIVIPSNRTLEMGRGTRFSVTNDHVQPTVLPLPRRAHYAMIRPDGTSSTYAENIIIRGVQIDGSQATPRIPDPVGTYFGIGIIYARNVLVEDCSCTWLQRNNESGDPGCYGIGASMAEHVQFVRCSGEQNGYQNLTVYDGGHHIDFVDCYSGPGWRTGFQIHRDASNIRVVNLVVRQHGSVAHSCVTMHGESTATAIRNVTFIGLDIESTLVGTLEDRGGVQCVGTVDNLTFIGGRIRSSSYGMYLTGRNHRVVGVDVESVNEALKTATGSGAYPTEGIVAQGCRFKTTDPAAPVVSVAGSGTNDRLRLSDCDIEGGGGPGLQIDGAATVTNAHISGNRIRTTGVGMSLASGSGMAYGNDLTGTTGITGGTGFTLDNNVGA